MSEPIDVLLISGSLRAASSNTATLRTAAQVAPRGIAASLYPSMAALPTSTRTTTVTRSPPR